MFKVVQRERLDCWTQGGVDSSWPLHVPRTARLVEPVGKGHLGPESVGEVFYIAFWGRYIIYWPVNFEFPGLLIITVHNPSFGIIPLSASKIKKFY